MTKTVTLDRVRLAAVRVAPGVTELDYEEYSSADPAVTRRGTLTLYDSVPEEVKGRAEMLSAPPAYAGLWEKLEAFLVSQLEGQK